MWLLVRMVTFRCIIISKGKWQMGVTLQMWHTYVTCDWRPSHFGVFLVWQTGVTFDVMDVRHILAFWCDWRMSHVTDVRHNFSCDTRLSLSLTDNVTELTLFFLEYIYCRYVKKHGNIKYEWSLTHYFVMICFQMEQYLPWTSCF